MASIFLDLYDADLDTNDDQAWGVGWQPGMYDRPSVLQATGPTVAEQDDWVDGKWVATPDIWQTAHPSPGLLGCLLPDLPPPGHGDPLQGVKIGGVPVLWDDCFVPTGGLEPWNLLFQMDATDPSEIMPSQVILERVGEAG
ncbi:hypothetical protein DC3_12720 [Deinococcus cellulosilyticus NBRC 106333 = KACC 11606]|uniref:Uncharacterized protein n=2 Tax=Deinococcus cellulosilyticus TaxID=401558 RepID=A0A511MZM4_DEIC1|nr:hypothetical protein DC3_12720 [Deinococcus cellulosilyticus NBRC 106333 = KACC 11606]